MNYDFQKLSKDVIALNTQQEFTQYLEFYFPKIEQYFNILSDAEVEDIKFDIEDFLYDMLDSKLILKSNSQLINAFLILLAEKFMQTSLIGAITIIKEYVSNDIIKKRLDASVLYLKVNDISNDYKTRLDEILSLLESATVDDEYSQRSIKSFFYFVYNVFYQFNRVKNNTLAKEFVDALKKNIYKYTILQTDIIKSFLLEIHTNKADQILNSIQDVISTLMTNSTICYLDQSIVRKENSSYSEKLHGLSNVSFDSIRDVAYKYLQDIGDPEELFYKLQRGEAIIDDEKLLYKYLVSFGGKHKIKLYSAYDQIISKLQNQKFNIVDWGCGQAIATMLLLDYARTNNIALDIENITLIEPSSLALSRGLLHIDLLKQNEYLINTINSDLDCLNEDDFQIKNNHLTLHLFSNILDLETFNLDDNLFKKISRFLENESMFVCVSPYRNDKSNNRIEYFYKYFDEHYDTKLISSRKDTIQNATRYEKIFISKQLSDNVIVVKENHQLDIIDKLAHFDTHINPILNIKLLEEAISFDPEYAIFKIRKVAEVITANLYSKYESNAKDVSFNDKIRYLSYEKNIFDKTITNYVQTIRTVGNRGVHESDRSQEKLKLDAHLVIIALVSFLQELKDKKIISG